MTRSRIRLLAPAVALVVSAGLVVLAVEGRAVDVPRAAVGEVVEPYFVQDEPTTEPVEVRTPRRLLRVWADGPDQRLPDDFGQAEELLPPEDGGFVRLDVDPGDTGSRLTTATVTLEPPATVLTLVAGDERVPLTGVTGGIDVDGPAPSRATRFVAVGDDVEDAGDLRLEVEYDGVIQVVDLGSGEVVADDGAGYGDLDEVPPVRATGRPPEVPCGEPRVSPGFRLEVSGPIESCRVQASPALPYVHGLGVAPAGRAFVALFAHAEQVESFRDLRTGQTGIARLGVERIEVDGTPVDGPVWLEAPRFAGIVRASPASGVAVVDADATTVPVRVVMAVTEGGAAARPLRLTYDVEIELSP